MKLNVTLHVLFTLCYLYGSAGASANSTWRKWHNDTDEILLARHLEEKFKQCGRTGRPVRNTSQPMTVWFGIRLIDFDLDEKTSTLKLSVWNRYIWYADCLSWNPDEFGGIARMPISSDNIWLPDITLVNTAEASLMERRTDVSLRSNGRVFWAPHRIYKSACAIDVTNYPYDTQKCDLWFQSTAKTSKEMSILPYPRHPFDLATYLPARKERDEWEILANQSARVDKPKEEGVVLMYSMKTSLRFSMTLRRRQGFFAFLLMLPCVFISFLATMIFCLPPERADRNVIGMNLLACLMLLLLILINTAPPSAGSIPKLGMYYGFNLIMVTSVLFSSLFVVSLSKKADRYKPVPGCIAKVVIEGIGRALFMRDNLPYKKQTSIARHEEPCQPKEKPSKVEPSFPEINTDQKSDVIISLEQHHRAVDTRLQRFEEELSLFQPGTLTADTDKAIIKNGWKSVAFVLDRLFFVLFIIADICAVIILFPWP